MLNEECGWLYGEADGRCRLPPTRSPYSRDTGFGLCEYHAQRYEAGDFGAGPAPAGVEKFVVAPAPERPAEKDWMETLSGVPFYPLAPRHCDIELSDIAAGLANLCRYAGQCQGFYSVAEHSVLLSEEAERRAQAIPLPWREVRDIARWGLLHDATEAYINDLIRPVKKLPGLAGFREIETKVMKVIAERFGLSPTEPEIVTALDSEILGSEVAVLKPNIDIAAWAKTTATGKFWEPIPSVYVQRLDPDRAREAFLNRFCTLWGYR